MLFCVLGNSGVGKDSVIEEVIYRGNEEGMTIKRLPVYTTRPPREGELCDPTLYYGFINEFDFTEMLTDHKFIETRSYNVLDDAIWYYGTTIEDFKIALLSKEFFFVPCTPRMFKSFYEYLASISAYDLMAKMYPIYITTSSEKERLNRLIKRAFTDEELYEACRRFAMDTERINDDMVPDRFTVVNNDLTDTATYVMFLLETFLDDNPNDSWIIDCTCRDTFGGLLY